MCNLYTSLRSVDAMRGLFPGRAFANHAGNLEEGDVYPDRPAPIIRADGAGIVLQRARWGMPAPEQYHSPSGIDRGVTNIRNTASPHWRRWLAPEHRCLVPFDRFAEPRPRGRGAGNAWFQVTGDRPAFFAGLWVPGWRSIRKLKDGETVDDLFGFLTCAPNPVVGAIHPKAMPVILVEPVEWDAWLREPWEMARNLQRSLADEDVELIES